ncbi:aspartate aminotransferase family protein [Oxyplasma meridianum]|uniref:Aspartate aminotransferase family protein n=1 Tax=Oxyplasma meridianum TaxID=3073602 RepID=A0AAX4NFR3_9ARCH
MQKENEWKSMMDAPVIKGEIPGEKSKLMLKEQELYETSSRTYTDTFKIGVNYGKNATIVDVDGNVFIDLFSGVSVLNMGHANPDVLKAITEQASRITHITEVPTEARIAFLKTLNSTLPGKMRDNSKVFTTVTGGDACELAIQLSRLITKKKVIIAFGGSYHGIAGNIVSTTANFHYRDNSFNSYTNTYHIPFPYPYRFPIKSENEDISKTVIDYLEYLIKDPYSGIGSVAGVMVEPIQGEGGYVVPPDNFMPMLAESTKKLGVPLIVDEIQTGMGRTGKIWASEHSRITPDIMCISKSVGGGIPISMIAYHKEYDVEIPKAFHLGTFRANPVGLAAGNVILNKLKNEEFLNEVKRKGKFIMEKLISLQEKSKFIGDVRGKGLMIGVEFVRDKKSREPNSELAMKIKNRMFNNGVLIHTCGHFANVIRFMPPLTIEMKLLEKSMEIFEKSLYQESS